MKSAILLHGMPSREEYFDAEQPPMAQKHWFAWLRRELISRNVEALSLVLPEPYDPDYKKWKTVLEEQNIDQETMLVGHSCGAGFLVRWLSENKVKVGKVALVAPWIDPAHSRANKMFNGLIIDMELAARTNGVCMFYSFDDDEEELATAENLKASITNLQVVEFKDRGHFVMSSMKTEEFPELRDWLLN